MTAALAGGEVLTNARVVTPEGVLERGWVRLVGGRIGAVGTGRPPRTDRDRITDLSGAWLLPGFIDLHVHGGGGHDSSTSPQAMAAAVDFHRRHGTTTTVVSLVAAPADELARQLGWVADLVSNPRPDGGHVVGAHLEGPFLSPARCGAQDPHHLRAPSRALLADLVEAGRGAVRVITVAPELPGALDVVADAVGHGIAVSIGHTDATYEQTMQAIDAGATMATHLWNGMRPMHHRDPSAVGAALTAPVVCELINDGVHVHPALARLVAEVPGRLMLVTDAMAAAGMGDGAFRLGSREVQVRGGEARLGADGSLAGSTLTMDAALRRTVLHSGLPIEVASRAASGTPARMLGLADRVGRIEEGLRADLVVLEEDLRLSHVLLSGRFEARPERSTG